MRRKKERSKQGQTNKQGKATQHTQGSEKTASGGTRTHDTLYSRQSALPTELPRQLSWLGPNLTSHSTPDMYRSNQHSKQEETTAYTEARPNVTEHETEHETAHVTAHETAHETAGHRDSISLASVCTTIIGSGHLSLQELQTVVKSDTAKDLTMIDSYTVIADILLLYYYSEKPLE